MPHHSHTADDVSLTFSHFSIVCLQLSVTGRAVHIWVANEQLDALEGQRPSIAHVQRAAMQLASQHLRWALQNVSLQAGQAGTCLSVLR